MSTLNREITALSDVAYCHWVKRKSDGEMIQCNEDQVEVMIASGNFEAVSNHEVFEALRTDK